MKNTNAVKTEKNSMVGEDPGSRPIFFKKGLPGLGKSRHFILQIIESNPFFYYLSSLDEEGVGLILVDPFPCFPDYGLELPKAEKEELELEKKEDVLVLATVTILGENKMTANLAAPIIINAAKRIAKQIILPERIDEMRTPLPLS